MLLKNTNVLSHHERLIQTFFQSLLLKKLVSYSVRILGLKSEVVDEMEHIGFKLFKCCCIHDRNITLREDIFARRYFREKIFSREDIFARRYFRGRYFRESRLLKLRISRKIFSRIKDRKSISRKIFSRN